MRAQGIAGVQKKNIGYETFLDLSLSKSKLSSGTDFSLLHVFPL